MKFTDNTRRALAWKREHRALTRAGYRCKETDWEIHRGGRTKEYIMDARISVCGKYVYTKIGPFKQQPRNTPEAPRNRPRDVLAICTAYESGYGHGAKRDGLGSPYAPGTDEHQAYELGYAAALDAIS